MKSFYKQNSINNDSKVDYTEEKKEKENLSFATPILNNYTSSKDKAIFQLYGADFYKFFLSGSCVNLPMFTEPPEPRAVKRIVVDKNFSLNAGVPFTIAVNPFDVYNGLMYNGTERSAFIQSETVNCFINYQVVCAKIMFKQVGIMSLNDGYGTVIDAAVVNPCTPVDWAVNNILSVQTGPGKKLMMVDGRTGVKAHFIGSPLYKKIYTSENIIQPNLIARAGKRYYLPANSTLMATDEQEHNITSEDGGGENVPPISPIFEPAVGSGVSFYASVPEGEILIIRVSPPSINVSLKLYLDLVVEGITKPQESTNMQQITPPVFFDFARLKYAMENFIPSLTTMDHEFYMPGPKYSLGFAQTTEEKATNHSKRESPKLNKKRKRVEKVEETIYNPNNVEHRRIFFKEEFKRKPLPKDPRGEKKYKDYLKKHQIPLGPKLPEGVKEFAEGVEIPLKFLQKKLDPGYAMDKAVKIKRNMKKKTIVNIKREIKLPPMVEKASEFLGAPSTELRSVGNNNRLFKDATTMLPSINYQYFPLVHEDSATPVCVAAKLEQHKDCPNSYVYKVLDLDEKEMELTIYYDARDFDDGEEFHKALNSIINFLYGYAFHFVPKKPISIKFFSEHKIKGTSYMYALLMALYGAPAGGYFTGSFTCTEDGDYEINEIPGDALKKKLKTATQECPLNVLTKDQGEGQFINIMAGIVPSYEEGQMVPTDDLRIATLYGMIPFKTRTVRATPYSQYTPDDKLYILDHFSSAYRKFIIAKNLKNPTKISNFLKDQNLKWKEFHRSDPDNFTTYIDDKKNYITSNEFYKSRMDLLDKGDFWHFTFNNLIFVDPNKFRADARAAQIKFPNALTEEKKLALEDQNAQIFKITEADAKAARRELAEKMEDPIFLKEKDQINIKEPQEDKDKYFEKIEGVMENMAQVIANIKSLVNNNPPKKKNKKKKIFYDDNSVQAMGLIQVVNEVDPDTPLENNPDIKIFQKFAADAGPNGPYVVGYLMGLEDIVNVPNPGLSVLKKIYNHLVKFNDSAEPVEAYDERSRDLVQQSKKSKVVSIRRKRPVKKKKEKDDKEDEKEEVEKPKKDKEKVKAKDIKYSEKYSSEEDE